MVRQLLYREDLMALLMGCKPTEGFVKLYWSLITEDNNGKYMWDTNKLSQLTNEQLWDFYCLAIDQTERMMLHQE
jgi:hypothetical protein